MSNNSTFEDKNEDFIICKFCNQNFNFEEHAPYILPECGHSICSKCYLKKDQSIANNLGKIQFNFACKICKVVSKISESKKEFAKNLCLKNILENNSQKTVGKCVYHKNGKTEFYCFDIKCLTKVPFCAFCIKKDHMNCDSAKIMNFNNIRESTCTEDFLDVKAWKEKSKKTIETETEKLKNRLCKIVDLFGSYAENRLNVLKQLNISDFIKNSEQFELREIDTENFQVIYKSAEFLQEISEDISRALEVNLFKEMRNVENQILVKSTRKLFNDPNKDFANTRLFAKVKKINYFVQQKYFLADFDVERAENMADFKRLIGNCFENTARLPISLSGKSSQFNPEIEKFVENLLRNETPNYAVNISQIEYFLKEQINEKFSEEKGEWQVSVEPNEVIGVGKNEDIQYVSFRMNEIGVTVYLETEN